MARGFQETIHRTICIASKMTQIERESTRQDERIKSRKEGGRQLQRAMRNAAMLQSLQVLSEALEML